jgi:large subunit ribosomal protein L6
MSRIGKQPVVIPSGVEVNAAETADGRLVTVKGPKGSLSMTLRPEIDLTLEDGQAQLQPNGTGPERESRAFHGLSRALLNNMVHGVSEGYSKTLEIHGVGWNAQVQGKKVVLNVGYCHPYEIPLPEGCEAECPNATTIVVKGIDKQVLGQVCADIRKVRPPEPYKGKGIRYRGEYVRRKAGKSFGS